MRRERGAGRGTDAPAPVQRSPPGTWRLLLPAFVTWGMAAWSVAVPGTARWVLVAALLSGTLLVSTAVITRTSVRTAAGIRPRAIGASILLCTMLVVVAARIVSQEHAREDTDLAQAADAAAAIEFRVELAGFPRCSGSDGASRAWVRAEAIVPRGRVPVLLWLSETSDAGWAPGRELRVRGVTSRLPPGGAAYAIRVDTAVLAEPDSARAGLGVLASELRAGLRAAAVRQPGAELVPGFAVGDTSLVTDALDAAMQESSLTHLTAVSGANCALVTGAVVRMLALVGVGRRVRTVCAGIGLGGFVVLVGPDASVQRAAVMAAVLLVSGFGGKRAVAPPALGLAMLVLLGADPWQALQPGFSLSVAATAGILLLAAPISGALHRRAWLPQWLALAVSVAVAAQIACGPLLLLLQPGIPAIGVLANVVAGPAAPFGTGIGLLGLLLLPIDEALGGMAVLLASLPARWVASAAHLAAAMPL
ncbi:ComEC/Rec2 family competence protein, partial [Leucobacter soli]